MKLKHYKGITYKVLTREEKIRLRERMIKILELNHKLVQEKIKTIPKLPLDTIILHAKVKE